MRRKLRSTRQRLLSMEFRRAITRGILVALLAGCGSRQTISYHQDVYPILETNCLECHSPPEGAG